MSDPVAAPRRRDVLGMIAALTVTPSTAASAAGTLAEAADLIVYNARVTTMVSQRPEAEALAVRAGKFSYVGTDADVMQLKGPLTIMIDAAGRRVIPGLNDSHTHAIRGGVNYALETRWDGVDSLEEALHLLRVQAERTPDDQFVRVVGGFSEHQFKERRLPTVAELDAAAPRHPVLIHYLYKSTLLNARAVSAFGYDRAGHATYPGGTIEKVDGRPTGRLLADPSGLVLYKTLVQAPRLDISEQVNSAIQFMDELNALGLTSLSDAGGGEMAFPDAEAYQVFRWLHARGLLTVRIGYHTFPQVKGEELADYERWTKAFTPGQGDDYLKLIGAGENLCWAAYDYEIFGRPRPDIDRDAERYQTRIMTLLGERGWPFRQHITYDETGDRLLGVYESVAQGAGLVKGWYVDHVETFSRRNLERVARLGGGVAIQNRLQFQAEDYLELYGRDRLRRTPDLRFMMSLGVPIGGGTDSTRVTSYNPWLCLQWLATGLSRGGMRMYDDTNLLTREEALRMWTTGSAWFTGDAGRKGAIKDGQLADFAVLDRDYFAVSDHDIAKIRSVLTVVGGQVVYGRDTYSRFDLKPPPPVVPGWSPIATFGDHRAR